MNQDSSKKWRKVVAKAWADDAYKKRLIENPNAVLAEEGIEVQEGVKLRVMEDSESVRTLVLPWPKLEDNTEDMEQRLAAFGYIGW